MVSVKDDIYKIYNSIAFKVIIFIIIISVLVLIYQNSDLNSYDLIEKDVSDMLPALNQNPVNEEINQTYGTISYQLNFQNNLMELKYEIFKYSTVEDAQENYYSIKNKFSELSIINLGIEGFGVEQKTKYSIVVFRTLNVVAKVELDGNYTTLDRTIIYAKKVRI